MKNKFCYKEDSSTAWAYALMFSVVIFVLGLVLISSIVMQEIPKAQMCSLELEGSADINISQYAFYGNFNSLEINRMTIKVPCDSYVLQSLIRGGW